MAVGPKATPVHARTSSRTRPFAALRGLPRLQAASDSADEVASKAGGCLGVPCNDADMEAYGIRNVGVVSYE